MSNSTLSGSDPPSSLRGITTTGIQDVTAILPLLGTDQCEGHVACALERGWFYAALTPVSIFGSLGIVKAGFLTLWSSINFGTLRGPRQLKNAGFTPRGTIQQLTYLFDADDSIYIAEDKIESVLQGYRGGDVTVNLLSRRWLGWNLTMVLTTMGLSSLGILPYIQLIRHHANESFTSGWLYPTLRIAGCGLTSTMVQIVIQLRVIRIIHDRLRFLALNYLFQQEGGVPPTGWGTNMRAEESLARLRKDIEVWKQARPGCASPNVKYLDNFQDRHALLEGGIVSFSMKKQPTPFDTLRITTYWFNFLQMLSLFVLCSGMSMSLLGYLGCFTLVQGGTGRDSLIWLGVEISLSIARMFLWASNPSWDDPPAPFVISRDRFKYAITWSLNDKTAVDIHAVIIGVDTFLGLPALQCTRDAEAVVRYLRDDLGVPESQINILLDQNATKENILKALHELRKDERILKDAPIVIYLASHSTLRKRSDTTASSSLAETRPHTPLDGDSGATRAKGMGVGLRPPSGGRAEIVTYSAGGESNSILYSEMLDILSQVAGVKGNNITVILDTCYSGDLAINKKFDLKKATGDIFVGFPTHVMLAACSDTEEARENENGGIFTQALVKTLNTIKRKRTSYRELIGIVKMEMEQLRGEANWTQEPVCSGVFQNRLIFNGILARKYGDEVNDGVITITVG